MAEQKKIVKAMIADPIPYITTVLKGIALEEDKETRLDMAGWILEALQELEVKSVTSSEAHA